jgi:hypothetical protein
LSVIGAREGRVEGGGEEGREEESSSRERSQAVVGEDAREGEGWRRAALLRRRNGKGTEKACSLLVLGLVLLVLLVLLVRLLVRLLLPLAMPLALLLLLDEDEDM